MPGWPVHRRHLRREESMSATAVASVAEAAGCRPGAVQPLYTVIDPDALDALVSYGQSPSWRGRLSFTLHGHEVTVRATGEVVVRPAE
jgi:hypothetical protein